MLYKPPYTISDYAHQLAAYIQNRIQETGRHPSAAAVKLRKVSRIKTIRGTLAIEGNRLTESSITALINGRRVSAPRQEIQEVQNALKVYDSRNKLNPFSMEDLLSAHRMMMEGLTDDCGRFRNANVAVTEGTRIIHLAPPAARVPQLMEQLFGWLQQGDENLLIKSCVFHYEFELIHPFSDGNGRLGRLWQSLLLEKFSPVFELLPTENMIYERQQAYYDAIQESTRSGDSGPFVTFMLGVIADVIDARFGASGDKPVLAKSSEVPFYKDPSTAHAVRLLELLRKHPSLSEHEISLRLGISAGETEKIINRMGTLGLVQIEKNVGEGS